MASIDAMDIDMDMDVDLVPDEPVGVVQDTPSPGEVVETAQKDLLEDQSNMLVPFKVHIRGVDVLNSAELRGFLAEHHADQTFDRIEWIDDSSANLLYASEAAAQEALLALSAVQIGDVTRLPLLELIPAKTFSKRPEMSLQIRFAVAADRKQAGAAQRSRFYLLNPEYDPENRPRRQYRDRGEDYGRHRRRRSLDQTPPEHFDVNLYDDESAALASRDGGSRRGRRSYTPTHKDRSRRSSIRDANRSKELFPERVNGQNGHGADRDRSASPVRDSDGDIVMENFLSAPARNGASPRNKQQGPARIYHAKELFPDRSATSDRLDDTKELASQFSLPMADFNDDPPPPPRRLHDRISSPRGGKLADRITAPVETGFSIRGAAQAKGGDRGFTIKGASKTAKELFPDKLGNNAGKELFSERLQGRSSKRRQQARDLFD